jgi:glyceraldehyde 3-phosphate dehydrogenase
MAIKVAINGYGRIGRNVLRAIYESNRQGEIQVVAINDLGDADTNAHLTQYDTAHGSSRAPCRPRTASSSSTATASRCTRSATRPSCPGATAAWTWCSSAPACSPPRPRPARTSPAAPRRSSSPRPATRTWTALRLRRQPRQLTAAHQVISNASCTTNCLAPLAKVLHEKIGIVHGLMTTIHAYTNDQVLTDVYHSDLRRARSATMSQIPTKTGAAAAVGLVLPELNGKLDGFAMRVPTINVSVVDLCFVAARATTKEEIDAACSRRSQGALKGILGFNKAPLVSVTSTTTRAARCTTAR